MHNDTHIYRSRIDFQALMHNMFSVTAVQAQQGVKMEQVDQVEQ